MATVLLPSASILKPVYAALAGADQRLQEAAILESDNSATDGLIEAAGGLFAVLTELRSTVPTLGFDPAREPSWGRFLVHPGTVEALYARYVYGEDRILELMAAVAEPQRLGATPGLPVKAGWDLWPAAGERGAMLITHGVELGIVPRFLSHAEPINSSLEDSWLRELSADGPKAVLQHYHPKLFAIDFALQRSEDVEAIEESIEVNASTHF